MIFCGLSQSAFGHVSVFRRNDHSVTQSEVGNNVTEPQYVAEAFADHFTPFFKSSAAVHISNNSVTNDFIS
jgi:hypothetical protein